MEFYSEALEDFEFWLSRIERKLATTLKKPTTRSEASQILSSTKLLQEECLTRQLPPELLDEDLYEEDPKISEMVDRYNTLSSTLTDNAAKAETLCACWDKLDADVSELTQAINSGGTTKITVDKLEESLAQLKEMFKERTNLIEMLAPGGSGRASHHEEVMR